MSNAASSPDNLPNPPFIFIGVFLAAGYWVTEAYFDTVLIENVSFNMRLFPSDLHELWMRSIVSVAFIGFGLYSRRVHARIRSADMMNIDAAWLLKNALSKTIRGNFPICAFCKNIRDQDGFWVTPDRFISAKTEAEIPVGICDQCHTRHAPDIAANEG